MAVQDNVDGEKINSFSVITYKVLANYICLFPHVYANPRLATDVWPYGSTVHLTTWETRGKEIYDVTKLEPTLGWTLKFCDVSFVTT